MSEANRVAAEQAEDGELLADTPCPACGKQVEHGNYYVMDSIFCPHCGADIYLECDEQYDEDSDESFWIYWWEKV